MDTKGGFKQTSNVGPKLHTEKTPNEASMKGTTMGMLHVIRPKGRTRFSLGDHIIKCNWFNITEK